MGSMPILGKIIKKNSFVLYSEIKYNMDILQNKFLQFGFEAFLIAILGYVIQQFFPALPWWNIAVVAGLVAFILNTKVKSFLTGFTGAALLWGIMAFQLSGLNMDLLATKVGEMLSGSEQIAKLGGINPTRLIYFTAFIGGFVGGFGAMTGSYARKMLYKNEKEANKEEELQTT